MKIENIMVPTDFSEFSDVALRFATSLARDAGAKLHIVHVKEPFALYEGGSKYGDIFPYPDLDSLKGVLENVVPTDANVAYQHWLLTGDVAKSIVQLAEEEDLDLIVLATHGRTGVSRMLMGSVAEAVLRRATCPVLTVKQPEKVKEDAKPSLATET